VKEKVVILGASDRPDRFAYKADKLLQSYGHETFLINPKLDEVEGHKCQHNLGEIGSTQIDTVALYVNPKILAGQIDDIIKIKPKRVIFNPGTEDLVLEQKLKSAGIEPVRGCTLVMLDSGKY
jgi:uncharacterized protein